MSVTVQSILDQHFAAYASSRVLTPPVYKAADALMRCRTAALGGHVKKCANDHIAGVWYNSCTHRCCPQCGALRQENWLTQVQSRLLSCPHYHVVFTMPHQLQALWLHNPETMPSLLFRSVRYTLMTLLKDPRYLGAMPGILMSLHTWGWTLSLHPHLHCLVTAGGLSAGQWIETRKDYLLPVQVVKALYRGKLLAAIRQAIDDEPLRLPADQSPQQVKNLLNQLGRKEWNVRIQSRYAHGAGVATYLARYVRGGPLRNSQLLGADDHQVTLRYQDHHEGTTKTLTLPAATFLQRLLWHVPEPGTHQIRYYGVYASTHRARLNLCRAQLGQLPVSPPVYVDGPTFWQRKGKPERGCCSVCGRPLTATDFFAPGGLPPPLEKAYGVAA